jgi:hypothetical protein
MREAMGTFRTGLSLALLAIAVTACEASMYSDSATPAVGYGNAVRQNSSVMIVDPQPATAANTQIDFDGRRAGLAIERYRQGKVIPPVELKTSTVLSE